MNTPINFRVGEGWVYTNSEGQVQVWTWFKYDRKGEADVRDGSLARLEMKPGDRVHVTPKTVHRMTAIEDCDIFEVSTPELDDVVRLEDRYGREDAKKT